jgi:uncharacterized protein with NRDE domain
MCLVLFAWGSHPSYRLIVAANRDEFYARPTAAAGWWPDAPQVLAGRDLRDGGTWMGVTRGGRFAAVTNYREPQMYRAGAPSRGHLVSQFLAGTSPTLVHAAVLMPVAQAYNGFNLLLCDGATLAWMSNRAQGMRPLAPGIYGLSNHLLDTPWPKVVMGKADLREAVAAPEDELEARLFASLARRDPAPDAQLPRTGIEVERERALSSAFIATPEYGTRCSTVLLAGRDGEVTFVERTTALPAADGFSEVRHRFRVSRPS